MSAQSSTVRTPMGTASSSAADGTVSTQGWLDSKSGTLRGALLGLLLERPGNGYDLANRLMARLGATWQIDRVTIYRLLDGLAHQGLAYGVEGTRSDEDARPLTVYHPTAETAAARNAWMEKLMPRRPVRLDLQAKLAVAHDEDVPRILSAFRDYERECLQLSALVAPTGGEPACLAAVFLDCTRESVEMMLRTEIAWATNARRRINEYVSGRG
jgi:DNA-binding PadR family transcriptional regulator